MTSALNIGRPPNPNRVSRRHGPKTQTAYLPEPGVPPSPDGMDEDAIKEWNRIVPELTKMGILASCDLVAVTGYCEAWSDYRKWEQACKGQPVAIKNQRGRMVSNPIYNAKRRSLQMLMKFAVSLGLTPSVRSTMSRSTKNSPTAPNNDSETVPESTNPFSKVSGGL